MNFTTARTSAAHILNSDVRIIDRTPVQIADLAAGIDILPGVGSGRRTVPGLGTGGGTGGKGTGSVVVIPGAGDEGGDAVAFDSMLDEVRPGDLITSDFMTRLLARINRLEAAARKMSARGDVLVPDLFGQPLTRALDALEASDGLLRIGRMFDTAGLPVDAREPGTRVVLGQHPAPGDEVDRGARLNLLVSFAVRGGQQPAPGGGTGGSGGTGGGIVGNIGIGEIEIVDGTRIVGGGTNVPAVTGSTPAVTGRTPTGPTPDDIRVVAIRPEETVQPGVVTGPTRPDLIEGAQPIGGLERVTDEVVQPAAVGGVTQPGAATGGTASVSAGSVTRPDSTIGGTVGGSTNVVVGGVTEAVTGRVTDAIVGGTSTAGINTIAGGVVGGANLRSEEAPMSEEAPKREAAPKPASKRTTKARPKK